jgi:hypothetical protein
VFLPSVSSLKTNLQPVQYLRFLTKVNAPHILVSAYDIVHTDRKNAATMKRLLSRAMKAGTRVMIDCGNYESYWKNDKNWSSMRYHRILRSIPHQLATAYDDHDLISGDTKNISVIEKECVQLTALALGSVTVPIVHARQGRIIMVAKGVANRLRPLLLAIPERELGDGIIERVVTLVRIRRELNKLGTYTPIHLLGTGNPLSLLLFSVFGADTFDGLEWCQTTVDSDTARLLHFHQRELLSEKLFWKRENRMGYQVTTLLHNITFFHDWMARVRNALINDDVLSLLKEYLDRRFLRQLNSQIRKAL